MTQHASDDLRQLVDSYAKAATDQNWATAVLHQSKPVYRVNDIMAKGRNRITPELEQLANSVVVAVLPASAPAGEDDLLGYYKDFLHRQNDGLMIGADVGTNVRTIEF
jgi:hypothetical protein